MTGILSQYMMRTILSSTALVLVVLLGLAGLFEFIAELDDTHGATTRPRRSFLYIVAAAQPRVRNAAGCGANRVASGSRRPGRQQ